MDNKKTTKSYIETGISNLNSKLYGSFSLGKLTAITGKVGVGKTAFMLQLIISIFKNNKKVLFYSLDRK